MGARRNLCAPCICRNKGIEEVRKGERRTEFGYSGTWNIVSKKGNAEINFF